MVHAIRIGDWSIEPVRETIYGPKNDSKLQIEYNFIHIPSNTNISRTITYIKMHTDDKILEVLANQAEQLTSLLRKEN